MADNTETGSGVGVCGLLGVAFVVLKLTGYIGWPWWIVTVPFWGPFALVAIVLVVILLGAGVVTLVEHVTAASRRRKWVRNS